MNSNLSRLEKKNQILARKLEQMRKAQQDFAKQKKTLDKELLQERLLQLGTEIHRVGYPIDKIPLIIGLALYGKELLENDTDADNKRQILSLMERYQNYVKEQESTKKTAPTPSSEEKITTKMDDDDE